MDVPSSSIYNINYCKMCDALWRVLSYPPSPSLTLFTKSRCVFARRSLFTGHVHSTGPLLATNGPRYKSYHPPLLGGADCAENEIKRCHSCCAFYFLRLAFAISNKTPPSSYEWVKVSSICVYKTRNNNIFRPTKSS